MSRLLRIPAVLCALLLGACGSPWNNPYPSSEAGANVFYTSFVERPKHLDPVQSYAENEYAFIANIYTPPLQYHYLKRPYELIPLAAELRRRGVENRIGALLTAAYLSLDTEDLEKADAYLKQAEPLVSTDQEKKDFTGLREAVNDRLLRRERERQAEEESKAEAQQQPSSP